MFENATGGPMIAVKDLKQARGFYEDVLDVEVEKEIAGPTALCHSAGTDFMLYESKYAGTNKANAFAWSVGDKFDQTMKELKSKGIKFEHYTNLPDTKLEGDIHVSGKMRLAWFKDPDGNILHVNNM